MTRESVNSHYQVEHPDVLYVCVHVCVWDQYPQQVDWIYQSLFCTQVGSYVSEKNDL